MVYIYFFLDLKHNTIFIHVTRYKITNRKRCDTSLGHSSLNEHITNYIRECPMSKQPIWNVKFVSHLNFFYNLVIKAAICNWYADNFDVAKYSFATDHIKYILIHKRLSVCPKSPAILILTKGFKTKKSAIWRKVKSIPRAWRRQP